MRYLSTRNDFLLQKNIISPNKLNLKEDIKSSTLIKETFENDISWGGSMIGRLINSTLRVAKIYYKTARIGSVISQVKEALDQLVVLSRTDEEQRNQIKSLTGRFLLEEIIKVVNSSESKEKKVAQLLGNDTEANPGLVQSAINYIKDLEDFPDKEIVIEKLENFKKALNELKSELGDLPESEDDDEKSEKEGTESSDEKSPISRLQSNYFLLLQSIRMIGDILKLNKVSVEPKIQIGKEYNYTDETGKKIRVKVIDTEYQRQPGPDSQYLTKDDVIDKTKKIVPKVLIAQKNAKGQYAKDSIVKVIDPKVLTESILNEELVGTGRGRGEGSDSEIKQGETDSKAAFTKIKNAYLKNDIYSIIPKMEEMKKKRLAGDKEMGTYMVQIMKQVFDNESTIGKPLTFQELIKEALNVQQTEYAPIIKAISVLGRVLLAFKEDMGLLQTMGELKKPITQFIQSYDNAKKILPEIKEEKQEKNESYKIFEAEEGENKEDSVKKSWRIEFTEEEEKKYNVDPKAAKKLQDDIDEEGKVNINVKDPAQYDQILRIVELFGKAYRMYAVDVIPSGRPNGRISQKTFRDYEYIGKDSGSTPTWKEGETPGYGPWAARITFEKWQDGIMEILQDTKYRTVLANSEFINVGPNQKKGSGLTLFSFMNDMLNEGGQYSNFRQRRHALLGKYFGGNAEKVENNSGDADAGLGNIKEEDAGTPNEVDFFLMDLIRGQNFLQAKDFKDDEKDYIRTFLFVKGKAEGQNKQLTIFIHGFAKINERRLLFVKFHSQDTGQIRQSLISKYLKNKLSQKTNEANEEDSKEVVEKLKLNEKITFKENEPLYYGIIEFEKDQILKPKSELKIKYCPSTELTSNKSINQMNLIVLESKILAYYSSETKKNQAVQVEKQSEIPSLDKTQELIGAFKSNTSVQRKFAINEPPKKND